MSIPYNPIINTNPNADSDKLSFELISVIADDTPKTESVIKFRNSSSESVRKYGFWNLNYNLPSQPLIPERLLSYMSSYLELEDILKSCGVSKGWNLAFNSDFVWTNFIVQPKGIDPAVVLSANTAIMAISPQQPTNKHLFFKYNEVRRHKYRSATDEEITNALKYLNICLEKDKFPLLKNRNIVGFGDNGFQSHEPIHFDNVTVLSANKIRVTLYPKPDGEKLMNFIIFGKKITGQPKGTIITLSKEELLKYSKLGTKFETYNLTFVPSDFVLPPNLRTNMEKADSKSNEHKNDKFYPSPLTHWKKK